MFRTAIATVSIVVCAWAAARPGGSQPVERRAPVVVELFTSEGCSSCPPADALLERLSDRRDGPPVIALGEHVDYWDHQGWKDRFSSAQLTHRQELYAARFANESIYTPQMVVDGRAEFVGSDAAAAAKAIDRAAALPHGVVKIDLDGGPERAAPQQSAERAAPQQSAERAAPQQSAERAAPRAVAGAAQASDVARPFQGRVTVTASASALPPNHDRADIVLAVTENHLSSDVKRGENHGRVLAHAAVVRQLITIGEATGVDASATAAITIDSAWKPADITVIAFVQERRNRAILAAGAVPLVRP